MRYDIELLTFSDALLRSKTRDALVAVIRAKKIKSRQDIFDALNRQIPDFYASNWDALHDLLGSLYCVPDHKVVIKHDGLPVGLTFPELKIYLEVLIACIESWRSDHAAEHSRTFGSPMHELEAIFPTWCRALAEKTLYWGQSRR